MFVGASASRSRAIATPSDEITAARDDAGAQALPAAITDEQGREYHLQQDPVSGRPRYRHHTQQRDQAGSTLSLEILIDLAADGSFTRRTTQQLDIANGDTQRDVVLAEHAADGTQLGERIESLRREGTAVTSERTTGTYAAGKLVRRESDIEQSDEATDATTGETTRVGTAIHGTWYDEGRPITQDTVPVVDRTDTQVFRSPGQGINKDTDRTITFTRHAAGPVGALDWDDAGSLVVRFNGRGAQYIERELRVPLDQTSGEPDMNRAETIRSDDRQNVVNKGLMQARVWGGAASNLSWVIGVAFMRGGASKALVGVSAAAAGAQLVGETHAIATRRNDGDWARLAMSAYDMLLTGSLAAYMSGRRDPSVQLTGMQRLGVATLGGAGLAMNGAELAGMHAPIGAGALAARLHDLDVGAALTRPATASAFDAAWRAEPRFDAAAALLG